MMLRDYYSHYDAANRVLIDQGVLKDGQVMIHPAQGIGAAIFKTCGIQRVNIPQKAMWRELILDTMMITG